MNSVVLWCSSCVCGTWWKAVEERRNRRSFYTRWVNHSTRPCWYVSLLQDIVFDFNNVNFNFLLTGVVRPSCICHVFSGIHGVQSYCQRFWGEAFLLSLVFLSKYVNFVKFCTLWSCHTVAESRLCLIPDTRHISSSLDSKASIVYYASS